MKYKTELYRTAKSIKTIRYECYDGNKYAVVEYTRIGETKPFRKRILHGV